jgi:ferredoxin-NADP reductase
MSLRPATVVSTRALSPSVRELVLEPETPLPFVAGQWVSVRLTLPNGEFVSRAYSIACPPRADGRIEIAVTRVEGGAASPLLHALSPGDRVELSHAQGFFTLEPLARPALFVGTGTGVAPLRSMILAALADADLEPRFVLLAGARHEEDILYRDELEPLARARPDRLRFEPTLSRGDDRWTGRRGYVQTHLRELVESLGGDCDVYVCGLNKMIKEVRATLKGELGFTRERIHTERYD